MKAQFGLGIRGELQSAGKGILGAVGTELTGAAKKHVTVAAPRYRDIYRSRKGSRKSDEFGDHCQKALSIRALRHLTRGAAIGLEDHVAPTASDSAEQPHTPPP